MGLKSVDLTNQNQVVVTWKVSLKKNTNFSYAVIKMEYQLNFLVLVMKQS